VLDTSDAIALGGLGILLEPIGSTLLGLLGRVPAHVTVLLDPNCRASAITDLDRYRATVGEYLARAHIVKVSVDDLKLLHPQTDPRRAARSLLALGPSAVLVTDGPAPVIVHTTDSERSVPVPRVDVVDTVGAGDAFVAGFLTRWVAGSPARAGVGDAVALADATAAAIRVAVAACTVRGASLPEEFEWPAAAAALRSV
jgi:fructokinase